MPIKITPSYIFTFLLLLLVMMELHEVVHISVGRIICGHWGSRDFNVWALFPSCAETQNLWWLATLAGPVFSFVMMWFGRQLLLSTGNTRSRSFGFALIFANIPFGRLSGIMMGGGDEMILFRHWMKADFTHTQTIIVGSIIVSAIVLPPVIKAWQSLANRNAWIYIIGFMTLPLAFLLIYLLLFMNGLLERGVLAKPLIMGTPLLITLHTVTALMLLLLLKNNLCSIKEE